MGTGSIINRMLIHIRRLMTGWSVMKSENIQAPYLSYVKQSGVMASLIPLLLPFFFNAFLSCYRGWNRSWVRVIYACCHGREVWMRLQHAVRRPARVQVHRALSKMEANKWKIFKRHLANTRKSQVLASEAKNRDLQEGRLNQAAAQDTLAVQEVHVSCLEGCNGLILTAQWITALFKTSAWPEQASLPWPEYSSQFHGTPVC